jgi:prepilin-type N-terminal cleavage/methylation domain-containing protein
MKQEQGFTIVEVIIAIMVLTIGLLALVNSSALVTRMIAQGQRSAVAATDAARILDSLRAIACTTRGAGSAVVSRGALPVDSLKWHFNDDPGAAKHYRLVLSSNYLTRLNKWRTDSMETYISCLF